MQFFNNLNSKNKKIIGLSLVIFLIILLAWLIFKPAKHIATVENTATIVSPEIIASGAIRYAPGAAQLSMVQSQPIPMTAVPIADQLSARIAYDEEVTARIGVSFSGRIIALKAAPGDVVKAGQALAIIDSPDFGTAFADLNKARADEKRKQLAMKRAKDLVPGEAISTRDWEAVQADYAQAQAETARAEQRLKNINPHDLAIKG